MQIFDHWQYIVVFLLGLVGKIESATHIDLNHDGRIGGTGAYRH